MPKPTQDQSQRVEDIARFALEKKAVDLAVLDVQGHCSYADTLLICSGKSNRQVQAICSHIEERMKETHRERPAGVEGYVQGHWVLLDYGDIIVHIFFQQTRVFYDLDGLWSQVPRREVSLG